jgi:hypothetical protein
MQNDCGSERRGCFKSGGGGGQQEALFNGNADALKLSASALADGSRGDWPKQNRKRHLKIKYT